VLYIYRREVSSQKKNKKENKWKLNGFGEVIETDLFLPYQGGLLLGTWEKKEVGNL